LPQERTTKTKSRHVFAATEKRKRHFLVLGLEALVAYQRKEKLGGLFRRGVREGKAAGGKVAATYRVHGKRTSYTTTTPRYARKENHVLCTRRKKGQKGEKAAERKKSCTSFGKRDGEMRKRLQGKDSELERNRGQSFGVTQEGKKRRPRYVVTRKRNQTNSEEKKRPPRSRKKKKTVPTLLFGKSTTSARGWKTTRSFELREEESTVKDI